MIYILILICSLLIVYILGFWFGRRKGKREGIEEGVLYAPLEIRRQCIEDGWCHICGHRVSSDRKLTRL